MNTATDKVPEYVEGTVIVMVVAVCTQEELESATPLILIEVTVVTNEPAITMTFVLLTQLFVVEVIDEL